ITNAIEWIYEFAIVFAAKADGESIDGEIATKLIILKRACCYLWLARIGLIAFFAGADEFHIEVAGLRFFIGNGLIGVAKVCEIEANVCGTEILEEAHSGCRLKPPSNCMRKL